MRNCSQSVSIGLMLMVGAVSAQAEHKGHTKIENETRVVVKTIPSPVRFEVSREVSAGRIVRAHEGSSGSVKRIYKVLVKNGRPVSKELVKELRTEPSPTIFYVGRAGHTFSRGDFERRKVLTMRATSYYSYVCGTGRTCTGERARYGVVAVDPRVIPLGTKVYVEGYGLALACDTGGAIKGNRIDLCFEDRRRVSKFSNRSVKVHILR